MGSETHNSGEIRLSQLAGSLQKVLRSGIVCVSHAWGGLEQVAAKDALELIRLGLHTQVICLEGSPIYHYLERNLKNLKNHICPVQSQPVLLPLNYRPRNYFDLKLRRQLLRLTRGPEGINLIHTHQTTLLGSIVPWFLNYSHRKIALFATRHIRNQHNKKDFFHRMLYKRLDALLVMSKSLRQNILETHSMDAQDVKVVHLGLDFEQFDPKKINSEAQRAQWGVHPDDIVIGIVGRIDPAKGQATFIKAAAGLLKDGGYQGKLKFVIVGQETLGYSQGYLKELKQIVSQFRMENVVIFDGHQENIPAVMKALDIFIMPSTQEAFGLVAIEAMAMECPTVVSAGGSAEEILGPEECGKRCGLMMKPEDAFDLQNQIRYLLNHPTERIEMGKKAREHVKACYDQKQRIYETLSLYKAALAKRII